MVLMLDAVGTLSLPVALGFGVIALGGNPQQVGAETILYRFLGGVLGLFAFEFVGFGRDASGAR